MRWSASAGPRYVLAARLPRVKSRASVRLVLRFRLPVSVSSHERPERHRNYQGHHTKNKSVYVWI